MKTKQSGFTLLELMVVVAIIGIMSSLAIPSYFSWVRSAKVLNAVNLTTTLKENINRFYIEKQVFPSSNLMAGLPQPNKLLSPEVTGITVDNGAFHIALAETVNRQLKTPMITVRPVYVADSPKSPISWICGNAPVPNGMTAAGENKTNVPYTMLPIKCRDLSGKITEEKDDQQ